MRLHHAFLIASLLIVPLSVPAYAQDKAHGETQDKAAAAKPFSVAALPYGYDALSPVIDTETMQLHHDKHHVSYADNLNKAVAADKGLQGLSLDELLANVSNYEPVVRNNAGGHYNHSLYWTLMAPAGKGGVPSAELLKQINADFGSLDKFKAAFETAGAKQFGSGWVWLVWTGDKLAITTTANQDNPLMDDAVISGKPILANDLWEHAYYLTYRNKRPDYLKAWWKVTNWTVANNLFATAKK